MILKAKIVFYDHDDKINVQYQVFDVEFHIKIKKLYKGLFIRKRTLNLNEFFSKQWICRGSWLFYRSGILDMDLLFIMYYYHQNHILQELILIPTLGIFLLIIISDKNKKMLQYIGLYTALSTFILSLNLLLLFNTSYITQFQFSYKLTLIPFTEIFAYFGLDGISLYFIILTTFLIYISILLGWNKIIKNLKEYLILFFLLEIIVINIFSILDVLIFYVFFESVLIPMFIIIGVWGSRKRKIHAAYQFFLYTLIRSLFLLVGILVLKSYTGSTDFQKLVQYNFSFERQLILWLSFFISFAIKLPMFPFHIWLPEAHVEAPTAGSILLAGILLKLGGYGMLRFLIILCPEATIYYTPLIYALSVLAIIYTSLTTIRQIDLKKIIAYSSVAHMNFVTIGIFTLNFQGLLGSILLMISHGFVSSALFLCIGFLYDRYKTRLITYYSGLAHLMPLFAFYFLMFIMANTGLPGTSNFIGEFLVLLGISQDNFIITIFISLSILLSAIYSIWLCNRILFGQVRINFIQEYNDINKREFIISLIFFSLIIIFGLIPEYLLKNIYSYIEFYV